MFGREWSPITDVLDHGPGDLAPVLGPPGGAEAAQTDGEATPALIPAQGEEGEGRRKLKKLKHERKKKEKKKARFLHAPNLVLGIPWNQSLIWAESCSAPSNTNPFSPGRISSGRAGKDLGMARCFCGSSQWRRRRQQEKSSHLAATGVPHPSMSTAFMGRSRPEEEACRLTPRSAHASRRG